MNPKLWISILLMGFAFAACSDTSVASIELAGLNYTNAWITTFTVDGYNGPGVSPNGGGGKFACCVNIPRKWHPGMKVTVRWIEDDRVPGSWKQQIVAVPEYTKQDIGEFVVHFYPDNTVKVLVTIKTHLHPDYPYPRPK